MNDECRHVIHVDERTPRAVCSLVDRVDSLEVSLGKVARRVTLWGFVGLLAPYLKEVVVWLSHSTNLLAVLR